LGFLWAAFNVPSCRLRQGYGVPRRSHFWLFTGVLQEIREKVTRKVRESLKGYAVAALKRKGRGLSGTAGRLQIITASLQKEMKKTKVLGRPFVPFVTFC